MEMESQNEKQRKNSKAHYRHRYVAELQKISLRAGNRAAERIAQNVVRSAILKIRMVGGNQHSNDR